jgi:hypothetical protein
LINAWEGIMFKYTFCLLGALVIEFLLFSVTIMIMFQVMESESAQVALYIFGGPVTIAVMGITIAMFEPWRYRVFSDRMNFRASRG